jgi:hypothetical protein
MSVSQAQPLVHPAPSLLILGVAVRLMMGVFLRAAADSVRAVGILHQVFDASNNRGGLVDSGELT